MWVVIRCRRRVLVARIGEALGTALSVRDVFEAPTVRGLAARVLVASQVVLAPVSRVVPRLDVWPLSFAQQRMWVINQFDPSLPTYNVPLVVELAEVVDVGALRRRWSMWWRVMTCCARRSRRSTGCRCRWLPVLRRRSAWIGPRWPSRCWTGRWPRFRCGRAVAGAGAVGAVGG